MKVGLRECEHAMDITIDSLYRQLESEAGISCLQRQVSVKYQNEFNLFTSKFLDKGTHNPQEDIDII